MAVTIDFAHLSLQDALDLAILIEEEAQERYLEFVDQMQQHHTPEAARFFSTMARNERRHGEELQARRRSLFADRPAQVRRSALWDVEAPDFDAPRAFMSARQAMEVALHAEERAYDFYDDAMKQVRDPDVHKLFEELRDEEVLHQSLVREALRALPAERPADPGDYEDPPVAQ